jgi:CTP:molybdopterin cytidylyltransferase MocA
MVAVILCAGASRRMGTSKGLLDIGGVSLLRAHTDAFSALGIPSRVVLGTSVPEHLRVLPTGVSVVWNARWANTDMAVSVELGLDGLSDALVTPVDAAPPSPATLRALLDASGACVPTFDGRDGHPVRVRGPYRGGRLDLCLRDAPRVPVPDPHCLVNLNDPAALRAWLGKR